MTEPIRDRIKELRRVKASELRANPRNWREPPKAPQDALRGVLEEVGYADALLARETDDGLELIDGHLRADITPDAEVPVLILDVTAEEADKILATLDPLAAMAEANKDKLGELLHGLETENSGVQQLLDDLAAINGIGEFHFPTDADGKEFDESCADDVAMMECPSCGHKFPK